MCVSFEPGTQLERLHQQVVVSAVAGRAIVRLRPRSLGPVEKLGEILRRHRGMHRQREDVLRHHRDRREARQDVEVDLEEKRQRERRVDADGDRVAVGRRLRDRVEPDRAAGAAAVLDDEGLVPLRLQARRKGAREQIGGRGRRLAEDDAHGAVGQSLRERAERARKHGGSAAKEQLTAKLIRCHGGCSVAGRRRP